MSKKTLGFLIILALIAAALLYAKTRPQPATLDPSTQSQSELTSEAQKISQAIASGQPYACTIVQGSTSIDYLVQGQNFRMTSSSEGQLAYALSDGEYLYSWSNQGNQGVKTSLTDQTELADLPAEESTSQPPSLDSEEGFSAYEAQGYTVDCAPATLTGTDFLPPADIQFIDPSAMFEPPSPNSPETSIDLDKLQQMAEEY